MVPVATGCEDLFWHCAEASVLQTISDERKPYCGNDIPLVALAAALIRSPCGRGGCQGHTGVSCQDLGGLLCHLKALGTEVQWCCVNTRWTLFVHSSLGAEVPWEGVVVCVSSMA